MSGNYSNRDDIKKRLRSHYSYSRYGSSRITLEKNTLGAYEWQWKDESLKDWKGNTRYTRRVLKCDLKHIDGIRSSLEMSHGLRDKEAKKVLDDYYPKFQFQCPFCQKVVGKKKEALPSDRKAVLLPTEAGYFYSCRNTRCTFKSGTLNQFIGELEYKEPQLAHQRDRYQQKTAGKGFNCPEPPEAKPVKRDRAYYAEQEQKIKEANAAAYLRKLNEKTE